MTQPLLGRCKDCDYALFVAPEQVDLLPEAKQLREITKAGVPHRIGRGVLARCDKGHRVFSLHRIEGTYSKDHKCDSRCLNAKGRVCKCSCGGLNHGRGYAATIVIEASVQEKTEPLVDSRELLRRGVSTNALLGEEGEKIYGTAKVTYKKEVNDATMYLLRADVEGETGTVKWFAPSYADPDWEVGDEIKFRAKVKRHETEYGNTTVVTYLEEI